MEYHADRFTDASLLIRDAQEIVALFPANRNDAVVTSHSGLTFGGVLSDERMRASTMLSVFAALCGHFLRADIRTIVYKAIPHIYHKLPSEEDAYALFRAGASVIRRDLASALVPSDLRHYTKGRKWAVKKGRAAGLRIGADDDFAGFMHIEEENLAARHGVTPVHTTAEISKLAATFPHNIKLYTARFDGKVDAGVVIYETDMVAHTQYIASTPDGRARFALDALIDFLLNEPFAAKPWFDFGISTENQGTILNTGLSENKESYGGRGVVYDFYEIDLHSERVAGLIRDFAQ